MVIGAGVAGLITANTAAEEGLSVVVVSASKGPVCRGGSNNAVYSKAMERAGLPRTPVWQHLKEIFYGSCNMDTKKWYKFYNNSEEAMNWAIDLMEEAGIKCDIEVTTPTDLDSLWAVPATSHSWLNEEGLGTAMGSLCLPLDGPLGLPASTISTVNSYNSYAQAGNDPEFHKRPDMLHGIKDGPFYGAAGSPGKMILTVLGGLRTNANMQLCDEADELLPGLHNVGTMVGDAFAGNYSFMVCGANYGMNCITFGHLTGKHVAENE